VEKKCGGKKLAFEKKGPILMKKTAWITQRKNKGKGKGKPHPIKPLSEKGKKEPSVFRRGGSSSLKTKGNSEKEYEKRIPERGKKTVAAGKKKAKKSAREVGLGRKKVESEFSRKGDRADDGRSTTCTNYKEGKIKNLPKEKTEKKRRVVELPQEKKNGGFTD